MENKIKFIQQVINNDLELDFDYVSKDMKVSFGKKVKPKEIKKPYLYAEDLLKENALKCYLIDGIQKMTTTNSDGLIVEFRDGGEE